MLDYGVAHYQNWKKITLIWEELILYKDQNAQKASKTTEYAVVQRKFWEMYEKIFETRTTGLDQLNEHASELKLNTNKFNYCLDSGKNQQEV